MPKILIKISFLTLLFIFSVWIYPGTPNLLAQQASFQGIITDHNTGEPLYRANIVLQSLIDDDKLIGVSAGRDGFYRVGSIDPGTWSVRFSFIGYTTRTDTLVFTEGESKTMNVTLTTGGTMMYEVVIARVAGTARREEGVQRITPVEMRRIPGPATGDLASYLQTLPGVVSMGDRGGQLFIRGGSPSENMVLVDGALIYQPSHIVGFFSPFPESLISGADFYAGGFGPRYSGRISSVLDVQMRHGNLYELAGSASVSPFAAEVFAEGPFSTGSSSWVFSARNSLIDRTSSSWYPIEQQPLNFQSQFFKSSYIQDDTRCSMMLMHTNDTGQMDFESEESIQWRNFILGGRCIMLPEGLGTLVTTNVGLTRFSNSVSNIQPFGFSSNSLRLNLDLDLRQYTGNVRVDYGMYTRFKSLGYDLGEKFVGFSGGSFTQFVLGGHFESTIPVGGKLDVQPGIAVSYNGDFGLGFEPRFRFTWQPFGRESEEVTGAAGLYLQPITGVSDIRDVSSVFIAWMSAAFGGSQMQALHTMLGWQQTLAGGFTWSVEGYYKQMQNLAVPIWNTIAEFTTDLALANGQVYGGDLRLEFDRGRFYGLLGYGYSWTLYDSVQDHFNIWFGEPIQEFHPPHDRRHQINALFSLDLGSYKTGVRWQLGTGMPFTRPMGFDDILDFRQRLPDVNRDRGVRRVIIDMPYLGRMPTTHRLDVSVERLFRLSNSGSNLNVQVGAINAYDQANIFYYDLFTNRRIDQLSFAPYLTVKLEFK